MISRFVEHDIQTLPTYLRLQYSNMYQLEIIFNSFTTLIYLQFTASYNWSFTGITALNEHCRKELLTDTSRWISADAVDSLKIGKLCPADCSFKGTCNAGDYNS